MKTRKKQKRKRNRSAGNLVAASCLVLVAAGLLIWSAYRTFPEEELVPRMARGFVTAGEAKIRDDELVIGVVIDGHPRAYPVGLLHFGEHTNDIVEGVPLLVSWCPLTFTTRAFDRSVDDRTLTFAFHRELHHGNLLLKDIESRSTWSQLGQHCVDGRYKNDRLHPIPSIQTTWKHWKTLYPATTMVRVFGEPYQPIAYPDSIVKAIRNEPPSSSPNEWSQQEQAYTLVLGLQIGSESKAYPLVSLHSRSTPFKDEVGGSTVEIHFSKEANAAWATDEEGQLLPAVIALLMPWNDFHPNTTYLQVDQ